MKVVLFCHAVVVDCECACFCVESTLIAICVVIAGFEMFRVLWALNSAQTYPSLSVYMKTEGLPSELSENHRLEKPFGASQLQEASTCAGHSSIVFHTDVQ